MPRTALHLVARSTTPSAVAADPLRLVFREHAHFVATVAHKLLGRDDEVDDIVQDVFVAALRGLGALRDAGAVRPWLGAVTVRTVRRRLRARRLRRWCGLDDAPETETLVAPGATPEDHALLTRIYAILDGLPTDQRMAWCLRYVHGYRLQVVAQMCECSLATAKRRIGAAHAVLESAVSDV
jgi:RNA polymerase sigma-70 factor, ECF subfamily